MRWPRAIKKAGDTKSDDVAKALLGLTWDTPVGKRTFSVNSHETFAPEYWGVMTKEAAYPFAVIKDPELLPTSFPATNRRENQKSASPGSGSEHGRRRDV